jgi:hypothetical protein
MTNLWQHVRRLVTLTLICLVSSAHVGSSLTVHEGVAGPYTLRILVRPPGVIPGRVEVIIRATTPTAIPTEVSVRPAQWRVGIKGAPPAEPTVAVPGEPGTFTTQLWIMESGSYGFHVAATGPQGSGTLVVPVTSVATTASTLPPWLGWILSALGVFLVLGLVSIVAAASRQGTLAPGVLSSESDHRRARRSMRVAACLIAALVFGGWKWWDAVDRDYRERLDKPLDVVTTVRGDTARALTLEITDKGLVYEDDKEPGVKKLRGTPLMPDHGKIMHLFLIQAGAKGAVAHLHPVRRNAVTFETRVPRVPAGSYWLFAEAVHESGFTLTMADTIQVPAGDATPNADGDDALAPSAPPVATNGVAALSNGAHMHLSLDGTPQVARDATIRVRVTEATGAVATLTPWLGMAGHAIVVRTDGQVFMHLHPMGSASMAARDRLARREAGDTTLYGEQQPASAMHSMPGHVMPMDSSATATLPGDITFPVAFPSAGQYRVFVQVRRRNQQIETAAMDVMVPKTLER